MKKLLRLVKDHIQVDFNGRYYIAVFFLLAGSLTFNYSVQLEDKIIDSYMGEPIRVLLYFILYSFVYYITCLVAKATGKNNSFLRESKFWIYSSFGLLILAFNSGFPYATKIITWINSDPNFYNWTYQNMNNLLGLVRVAFPLLLISYLFFPNPTERLGLNNNLGISSIYKWLLLLILPFVVAASLEPDFRNQYPTYERFAPVDSSVLTALFYELCYGSDFVNVELLFRGFFVIGLSHWMGREAIIPMTALYCSLHFGKPIGEAISSIFGGYILGILALYTRNIWGGIILHIGLAWMMEAVAYFAKTFANS